jgi:hypothetical protein
VKYNSIKYFNFNVRRKFGVELEMGHTIPKSRVSNIIKNFSGKPVVCTGYKLSSNNNFWHVKDDSTCGVFGKNGPKGVEVASYVAEGAEDIDHISFVGRMLSLSGCKTNVNCGYHIHVEVKDFDVNNVGVLLGRWLKIEPWIENMIALQRRNNRYCKSLCSIKDFEKEKLWKPQDLFVLFSPKNLNTFENDERKVSLNLVNYVKYILFPKSNDPRGTLELRCPEGTLDYNEIKNWLYFFLNFVESCKNKDMPSNLLPCSNIDDFLSFAGLGHQGNNFYVFSKELFDARNWVLRRLVSNGSLFYNKRAKKKVLFLNDHTIDTK